MEPVRVGILGCASIVGWGLMDYIDQLPEIEVINIASRDPERARQTALQYGIKKSSTYNELLLDTEVELVYIPLPNALHAAWSIKAMEAGKAVLCEKPLCSNAEEGEKMAEVVKATGMPFIEAVHYRYHPLAQRIVETVKSGVLGKLHKIEARLKLEKGFLEADDIRFSYPLAGGATMDPGCYCVNMARLVTGEEPVVTRAEARLAKPDVDVEMKAQLLFPSGCVADLEMAMVSEKRDISLVVHGEKGTLEIDHPIIPHVHHRWVLDVNGKKTEESFSMTPTFVFQFREVAQVIRKGVPIRTTIEDGIRNMRVLDSIYQLAGMRIRGEDAA